MTPPPPTPNPTPKAVSGAGALLRRLWDYYADENEVPPHDCEFKDNPEAGKCDFHELWGEIDALMRATATPPQSDPALAAAEASIGVSYQSACSGLWYSNASAAGTIRAIKIGVEIYELKQDAPAPAPEGRGETAECDALFPTPGSVAWDEFIEAHGELESVLLTAVQAARRLERERDEARVLLGQMHKAVEHARNLLRESANPFDEACTKLSEAAKLL